MTENEKIKYLNARSKRQAEYGSFSKKRFKRIIVIAAVFGLLILGLGFQLIGSAEQLHQTNDQIATKQRALKKQKNKKAQLDQQGKMLNNKNYLQELVRAKFYYSKKGETVYSLPGSNNER